MKWTTVVLSALIALLLMTTAGSAGTDETISVVFVGQKDNERTTQFQELLEAYFEEVAVETYSTFYFYKAKDYDVVIFDFNQGFRNVPLEMPENWSKPTILISSGNTMLGRDGTAKIDWL